MIGPHWFPHRDPDRKFLKCLHTSVAWKKPPNILNKPVTVLDNHVMAYSHDFFLFEVYIRLKCSVPTGGGAMATQKHEAVFTELLALSPPRVAKVPVCTC